MAFYGRLANVKVPRFILPLLSKSDKKTLHEIMANSLG